MDCKRDREELSAYIDGELAPAPRAELESHIQACASCRAEVAAQDRLAEAFASLREVTPPGDFEARFWARIAREKEAAAEPAGWRRWLTWPRALTAAAVTALGLILLVPAASQHAPGLRIRLPHPTVTADADPNVKVDVKIVSNPKDYELLQDPDMDAISEVDVLEDWDDAPPS
ncbi:MAG TPA: zf-HC2 domain-containing protein [Myxococcota bacterium]|nr:zf-HC2 domain-containing protein [Myxococcota bacterium]